MKNENKYITILSIIALLFSIGIYVQLQETPNERSERINRNADQECGVMQDVMARNCYAWYYEQIEDRE